MWRDLEYEPLITGKALVVVSLSLYCQVGDETPYEAT